MDNSTSRTQTSAAETCPFNGATTTPSSALKEPPGDMGATFFGKMKEFGSDPFGFSVGGMRKHGSVWKTRLIGSTIVFFSGPKAFTFFMDPANFTRENATAKFIQNLFHPDAVPFLDGERHKIRKWLLLEAFTDPALESYLPSIFAIFGRYAGSWLGQDRPIARDVKQLVFDMVNVLFAAGSPQASDRTLTDDFTQMVRGSFAAPINLPGTTYRKAIHARDRLRVYFKKQVAENEGEGTALGFLKQARGPKGEKLTSQEIEIELLHFFFAATSALSAALAWSLVVLGERPELAARLRAEADGVLSDGTPSLAQIRRLTLATQVSREVLRTYPMASTTFVGVARRDLEIDGMKIRAGWKGIGLPTATLQDASTFRNPGAFEPDRLSDEALRALPENAFVPMGGGPRDGHRCGGEELVKMVMPAFISWFVRNHDWTFPEQDVSPGPGSVGPLPKGGLRMQVRKRARGGAEQPIAHRIDRGRTCTDW